jgi:GNAT superfamily N-acetyltransferase
MTEPIYRALLGSELSTAAAYWMAMNQELALTQSGFVEDPEAILDAYLRDGTSRGTLRVFGAQLDGEIVGSACAALNNWGSNAILRAPSATIVGVYVLPPFRRRGIARGLTERAIEWCRAQGCEYVRLQASAAGRPLYESLGFTPGSEMRLDLRAR